MYSSWWRLHQLMIRHGYCGRSFKWGNVICYVEMKVDEIVSCNNMCIKENCELYYANEKDLQFISNLQTAYWRDEAVLNRKWKITQFSSTQKITSCVFILQRWKKNELTLHKILQDSIKQTCLPSSEKGWVLIEFMQDSQHFSSELSKL